MNKAILMGRLTRDPEVRWTQGEEQKCMARFTLAVDRGGKKQDGQKTADFISCVAFGRTAEFVEKYCVQGIKLVISGRIQTGSYTNRDGAKVYTTDVVVDGLEFAESKKNSDAGNREAGNREARQRDIDDARNGHYGDQGQGNEGFMNIPDGVEDEGLPFN